MTFLLGRKVSDSLVGISGFMIGSVSMFTLKFPKPAVLYLSDIF